MFSGDNWPYSGQLSPEVSLFWLLVNRVSFFWLFDGFVFLNSVSHFFSLCGEGNVVMRRSFRAPAKINLCLHVLGRLDSGYHVLAMAMQRVSLYDDVVIEIGRGDALQVCCDGLDLAPGEENIAARAVRLLLEAAGIRRAVSVSIIKRIPVAAGLGGGSSDAATVLTGVNDMLGLGFDGGTLQEFAARLGSDVPFFIFGAPAWATGTGTTLENLPGLPSVSYVLVNPGVAVSTKEVYQSLRLTKGGDLASIPRFSAGSPEELCRLLHNDLEQVVLPRYPVVGEVKARLRDLGAMGSLMSGSGATVFGVFTDPEAAGRAAREIRSGTSWFAESVVAI